ncbi:hypothetical protein BH11PLA2_BH11PLA2_06830 [soil metagenome]
MAQLGAIQFPRTQIASNPVNGATVNDILQTGTIPGAGVVTLATDTGSSLLASPCSVSRDKDPPV